MGGFRSKLAGIVLMGIALSVIAGCTSKAGTAISDEGEPTADTGMISAGTTGGDAAGTLNLKKEEKAHEQEGH